MLRERTTLLLAALLFVGLAANGCNNSTTPSATPTVESQNLNDPNGGFNTLAAQPGFGDLALNGSGSLEAAATDPLETTDPQVTAWSALPDSVHAYGVTLLWGILRKDPAIRAQVGEPHPGIDTDWSGSATVNHGALVVRSTVAFSVQDRVVLPRVNRRQVEWISHTTDSFDGLRLWVYQRFPSGANGSGDSLTIIAGSHSWKFRVNDLAAMDTTYVVDQSGNRFAIQAFRIERGSCTRGFLGGIWLVPASSGANGLVRGRVIGNHGQVLGHIKGFFGTNSLQSRVFFAKYIDVNGLFKGIIRGTWTSRGQEVAESGSSATGEKGSFRGVVIDGNGDTVGAVHGRWHSRPDNTDGFLQGTWSVGCAN